MDKVKVNIAPTTEGEVRDLPPDFLDQAAEAGWTDDPGTGHSVLLPDERGNPAYEVCNPLPVAPPIGWQPTPAIDELIRQRVQSEVSRVRALLGDDEEIDDINDAEDFDVPDDLPNLDTIYEVIAMQPEVPQERPKTLQERAREQAEYDEVLAHERHLRVTRSREEWERRQKEAEALYGPPPGRPGGGVDGGKGA